MVNGDLMDKIKINDIGKYKDQTVQLDGWIYNSRRSGKIGFLMFRDGFGLLQCIIEKSHIGEIKFEEFKKLTQETSIKIIGSVVSNERAPGGYEVFVDSFEVYQLSVDYPISPKEHGTDFLMNNRH